MKHVFGLAAVALLAACSPTDEEADATAADEAAAGDASSAETATALAADGQPAQGNYKITLADGTVFMEELKPDGTYVQTNAAGEVVETGTWVQKTPEEFCYTADADYVDEDTPADEQCNTEGIDDAGVWTSTNAEGESVTVERVTS